MTTTTVPSLVESLFSDRDAVLLGLFARREAPTHRFLRWMPPDFGIVESNGIVLDVFVPVNLQLNDCKLEYVRWEHDSSGKYARITGYSFDGPALRLDLDYTPPRKEGKEAFPAAVTAGLLVNAHDPHQMRVLPSYGALLEHVLGPVTVREYDPQAYTQRGVLEALADAGSLSVRYP